MEAFEATSRHMSLTKAAAELGVTQSAVSHHIRYLSQELGQPLLTRTGRVLLLTPVGQNIASRIQAAFAEIDRSIAEAAGEQSATVRLALCSAFAPGWLIKRLASFNRRFKDVDLQLFLYARRPDLSDYVADAFIIPAPQFPGFSCVPLQAEELVAVRSPSGDQDAADLPIVRKLKADPAGADDWLAFCQGSVDELARISAAGVVTVSHYVLAYEIAKRGAGIALVPDFLVQDDLAQSTLRTFGDARVSTGRTYNLFIKESRRSEPALKAVATWLRSQGTTSPPE